MSSKRKADSRRSSKPKTRGKPETSIPKFITEPSPQPDAPQSKTGASEDVADAVLQYCVVRNTLDFDLLTKAEKKTFKRLIRKMIPK